MFDFLFNRARKDPSGADEPEASQVGTDALPPREPLRRPSMRVGSLSDLGRQREINEDALATLAVDFEQDNQRQTVGVFIVADGMGGHDRGELASEMAARTVLDELLRSIVAPTLRGIALEGPLGDSMQAAVKTAHERIRMELPGSGTTLTVALAAEDLIAIAHVGDSRAYLYRDGAVAQVTHDHSFVARLVEIGQATPEEAAIDPRRNYLLRALGQADDFDVDFQFESFPPGSRLLLCSDGLWGHVDAAELERILRETDDPQSACQSLIDLANASGGPDNISAVIVMRT
jgi:serine/threonine protein phosphatase PrpC